MDQVPIPNEIKRFIWLGIPSIPYLEAILLMRDSADKSWDYEEIARRLYLGEAAAQALLAELFAGGIIRVDAHTPQRYYYRPNTKELGHMLDLLAVTYTKNLVGVTHLIHSKLTKKAQQFADAFRWRKDKESWPA